MQAADLWAFFVFARGRNGQVQAQDADNLIAWLKAPIDSLVDGGLLEDDRWVTYRPPIQVCSLSAKSELVLVLRPS